jgi:ATP-binding cassette subfamily B protein
MKLVKEFVETMKPVKGRRFWYYFGIVGMTIGNTSIGVVSAILLKEFVDAGNMQGLGSVNDIIKILVAYILTLTLLIPSCQYLYNRVAKLAYRDVKQSIFYKILKLPIPYFEKVHSGKIMSVLINDCEKMMGVITGRFRRTFAPFIQIITYVIPMFYFEWRITILLILINFITLYGDLKFAEKIKKLSKNVLEKLSCMNETLMNIFNGMLIVRMFSLEKVSGEYIQANEAMSVKNLEKAHISGLHNSYTFVVSMINTVLFLLCANILVMLGLTTYGSILGIMSMQIILNESFKSFCQYLPQVIEGHAGASRVYEFLNLPEEEMIKVENANDLSYIEFRNVNFKYPETEDLVLEDFNLKIKENETIAVIGESGSGKSTIAKLLLGFYPIEKGTISVDGRPIHEKTLPQLRNLISYVPQDAYIFNGTIMENIRYGKPSATDKDIYRAARIANAYDFIVKLTDGFHTVVGERGAKLSGGQRQRIAIARAILKDAPILILDEATASLDSESEALIKSAVDEVRKNKTTIIIAHRLSTIEGADRVIKVG